MEMSRSSFGLLLLLLGFLFVSSHAASDSVYDTFVQCLSSHSAPSDQASSIVYAQTNSSFIKVLQSYIRYQIDTSSIDLIHRRITSLSNNNSSRNHYTKSSTYTLDQAGSTPFNAILGSLSPTIIPFIAQAKTAREAWTILANTYAKRSRGRIKEVKNQLKQITKGSMGVFEFLQTIKARVDELSILSAAVDDEDLLEKILEGLDEDYKELVRAVQARDTPISFDELHEKFLNFEVSLQSTTKTEQSYFPASANSANRAYSGSRNLQYFNSSSGNNTGWRPPSNPGNSTMGWHPSPTSGNHSLHPLALTIYVQIAALQSLILATAKSVEFKDIQLSTVSLSD
ncbi:Retrovirus-related Pol polyprotein from transposon RE1 [Vitis vinifera]|uniref:Retrovirus-related Pol polyprotein from transposon RE1 n=1 Tax=Vitis vinifera TaxID=29760 RepID=A0A438E4K4_VITVI|nr:Retrovirus-related Pol polyprotein from transposon RE1 [Vitis vinifera]